MKRKIDIAITDTVVELLKLLGRSINDQMIYKCHASEVRITASNQIGVLVTPSQYDIMQVKLQI